MTTYHVSTGQPLGAIIACLVPGAAGALLTATICILSWAAPSRAAIVVSNLGSPGLQSSGVLDDNQSLATQFTAGPGLWQIDAITLRLEEHVSSTFNPDELIFQIRSDNSGAPGATVLGQLNMSVNNITTVANYSYPPLAPITLAGSASYWLVGLPTTAVGMNDYRWRLLNANPATYCQPVCPAPVSLPGRRAIQR
jgi:hypothetical protein